MSLSTQAIVLAKRRAHSAARTMGLSSSSTQILSALFQELAQKKGSPDLQVVEYAANGTTDAIIADSPCKLYGVFLKGGASAADLRWADHASSANTPTTTLAIGASEDATYVFSTGKAFTTGLTCDESGASGSSGFFIIGKP